MKKLLVIADPHIRRLGLTIAGLDTFARFQQTLAAAVTDHPDAEALILLGDLTHDGEVAVYERLRAALSDLPFPIIPLLGNHDQREAFAHVFPDTDRTPDGFVQTSQLFGRHRVITLDTLDGPPYRAGHHSGWLCEARLGWLDRALTDAQDDPVIVVAHHPPHETGIVGMDAIKLRNGPELIRRLAAHGSAYLLCGHLHRAVSGVSRAVPWTIFKSSGHQGALDLTDPDSSLSLDEPPNYGVVLLAPDGVIVHSQDVIPNQVVTRDPASVSGAVQTP